MAKASPYLDKTSATGPSTPQSRVKSSIIKPSSTAARRKRELSDRFIPRLPCKQLFRFHRVPNKLSYSSHCLLPPPLYHDQAEPHMSHLAGALGLDTSKRVLHFTNSRFLKKDGYTRKRYQNGRVIVPVSISSACRSRIIPWHPDKVLDAPGLRDDFYSSLIVCSRYSDSLIAGLGSHVFIWNQKLGVSQLPCPTTLSEVTCLALSPDDLLLIGRADGTLALWDYKEPQLLVQCYQMNGVGNIIWKPFTNCEFLVGTKDGSVILYRALNIGYSLQMFDALQIVSGCVGHTQQICGMAWNNDGTQLATGANDNTCIVWDYYERKDELAPRFIMRYKWNHQAAVKAIAFCDWSNSLLATGGGSLDRTIRFWHTHTGTLIRSIDTEAQITSLIWSPSLREIVATFGFSNADPSYCLVVFEFPSCKPIAKIPWGDDKRAISAVISPDKSGIWIAATDGTLRFHRLWQDSHTRKIIGPWSGIFNSDLLEMSEGLDKKSREVIR